LGEANRNALILLAGSIVFVGVVASVLGSRLTRPIRNLTDIADHISHGELGAEIAEVHRSDEIGGLAKAIDRLKASVAVAMKRLGDDRRPLAADPPRAHARRTPGEPRGAGLSMQLERSVRNPRAALRCKSVLMLTSRHRHWLCSSGELCG
jgi:HAMP domain-containing protein